MNLKDYIKDLPNNPGIYKYFDASDKIIYVGKAKNLKKRVSSYFLKNLDNNKTKVLVSKIARLEFVVVDNETEALLLENSLIKELQPRYNMLLKDDKSFPLIRITKERFPKIFPMRNPIQDGSEYYGPYTSSRALSGILDLIKSIYPIRNCNYLLTEDNIESNKFRACLEYQIGNCNAPCIGKETEEEYMESIKQIRNILKGNFTHVKTHLKMEMTKAADELRFEDANKFKIKLDSLEMFRTKSTVVSHKITDVDVYSCVIDDKKAFVNFIKVVNGMVVSAKSLEFKLKLMESQKDVLEFAIPIFRQRFQSNSNEIIVPIEIDSFENLKITVPKAGDKKKLLDFSVRNILFFKKQKLEQYAKLNPDHRVNRLMTKMKDDLRLSVEPRHIECFDNSNLQGTNPVSACVVFKNGKPSKKDYRHFNIKTVIGPNDFDSMKEVVQRRYSRLINEKSPLPDLIIIDGGKGQLSAVVETLKSLDLYGKISVVGIAKRLEEIYYPGDSLPMYIDKASETLKVIQHLRDEAHRFGITHHRDKRSKQLTNSQLFDIHGVGEKTIKELLTTFRSVKKIKEANLQQLIDIIGPDKANKVYKHFQSNGNK